jgi:hypothetical protein
VLGSTASIGGRSRRTRRKSSSVNGVDDSTNEATRCGWLAARCSAITPPVWWPTTWARATPHASSSSTATAAQASMLAGCCSGAESPKPGVSIAIAKQRCPSRGSTARYSSQLRGVWCNSSTAGAAASPQLA